MGEPSVDIYVKSWIRGIDQPQQTDVHYKYAIIIINTQVPEDIICISSSISSPKKRGKTFAIISENQTFQNRYARSSHLNPKITSGYPRFLLTTDRSTNTKLTIGAFMNRVTKHIACPLRVPYTHVRYSTPAKSFSTAWQNYCLLVRWIVSVIPICLFVWCFAVQTMEKACSTGVSSFRSNICSANVISLLGKRQENSGSKFDWKYVHTRW